MSTLPPSAAATLAPVAPPQRQSWSLATKILCGLVLNLLVIGALATTVFFVQLRLRPDWLLAGRAGERLQAAAELIADELSRNEPSKWDEVLERFGDAYRITFVLLDQSGAQVGGAELRLPEEVLRRIAARGRFAAAPAGPRVPLAGPRKPRETTEELNPASPPGPPFRTRRGAGLDRSSPRNVFPRFVVRAGSPPVFWAVLRLPVVDRSGPGLALVARIDAPWRGGLFLDIWPWILAGLGTISLSALLWLPFVRRITRDVTRMTRQTGVIAAGRFDDRLNLRRADELGRLAEAIDSMAARLADQAASQRRFLGDAAHELCSPLARLQAAVAILEEQQPAEQRSRLRDISEELEEMAALVDELLAFSRATHGRTIQSVPVDLAPLVQRAWHRESAGSGTLVNELPPHLRVRADPALLSRAVANVLRNALRYAGEAGPITVRAQRDGTWCELIISDRGPGVPTEALPHLFEPFYRPEASRNREFGGAGLGLAIVKTCLDACGGTATTANLRPHGFEVTLRLPVAE
ncbi:MAG: HAMP domain-containing protein [Verrucomicrobiales bacterium]|nr:HAMP domain-containing protein [Verrucomicrobiales bacterium]